MNDHRCPGLTAGTRRQTTGQIEQVIIGVGGFLGLGERSIALPMDQVSFQQATEGGERRGYISAESSAIESLPEYQGE